MSRNLKYIFVISICFILACAMSSSLVYDVSLDQVERPEQAKIRYGDQKIIRLSGEGVEKYQFEDEMINIIWIVTSGGLSFELFNKTNYSIKIVWDEAAFVGVTGQSQRVMHSGVKYIDRNNPQPPSIVIRNGNLSDIVIPTDNIYYASGKYGGWREAPILPNARFGMTTEQLIEQAKPYIGKSIQVLLPLQIEDVVNEYIFSFKINDALLSGNSIMGISNIDNKSIESNNENRPQQNDEYISISKISKEYILILRGSRNGIQIGDTFQICSVGIDLEYSNVGVCEAIKVLEDKTALKVIKCEKNHTISLNDKIKLN